MPHEQGAWMLLCVSGGAVRVQTAASPRAGTCRLRRFGGRGDGKTGEMARFPKKGYPRDCLGYHSKCNRKERVGHRKALC